MGLVQIPVSSPEYIESEDDDDDSDFHDSGWCHSDECVLTVCVDSYESNGEIIVEWQL